MDLVHTVVVGDLELRFRDLTTPTHDVEFGGDEPPLRFATGPALPPPHPTASDPDRPVSAVPAHERLDVPH